MLAAVIMAGGYGERFWPLSRKSKPKQVLPIHSDNPMIMETVNRLVPLFGEEIYISTNADLAGCIRSILPDAFFIIEPSPRNTAACIGLAAIQLMDKDPDAIMFLETSDHYYNDEELYLKHVKFALKVANSSNKVILIGIEPTHGHTGLGYIKKGNLVYDEEIKVYDVEDFVEKPDRKTAEEYVSSGNFLWNSGMFICRCSVMLEEISKHMPKLHQALVRIHESGYDEKVLEKEFEELASVSIDYGVMEKSDSILVLDAKMHWDDIGDLASFERFTEADHSGNVVKGEMVQTESSGNIVIGGKLIALVGVSDLLVVETDDVVLVARKDHAQDVKTIVKKLLIDREKKKYVI